MLSLRGRGQGTGQARVLCSHQVHTEPGRVEGQGHVALLQRLGFRLLVVTEENSGMRHDGIGNDNFLGELGNLYVSPENLEHQNGPWAIAPSSSVSRSGGGGQAVKWPLTKPHLKSYVIWGQCSDLGVTLHRLSPKISGYLIAALGTLTN